MKGIGVLLGFLVILFVSCEPYQQKFEPEPNIFAVMVVRNTTRKQYIIVDRSFDIKDTLNVDSCIYVPEIEPFSGIDDAEVIIYTQEDTVEFWNSHYKGLYEQSIMLEDNKFYALEVRLPWGDTVTAESYMPSELSIACPKNGDTISIRNEMRDSTLVCWNRCENVSLYVVYFGDNYWGNVISYPHFTTDTCCQFFALRASDLNAYSLPYTLMVMGISSEYVKYMDPRNKGRGNLSSGYGVFTGITIDTAYIYIVE